MNDKRKTFGKNKNFVDDKMKRIKKALDLNNIYDKANIKNFKEKIINKKKDIKPMDCINSILMSKILKYNKKDIRDKIISLINYILSLIFNSFYFFTPNLWI